MHFQFYYPDSELSLAYGAKQREVEEYSVLSDFYFGLAVTLGTPQPITWFIVHSSVEANKQIPSFLLITGTHFHKWKHKNKRVEPACSPQIMLPLPMIVRMVSWPISDVRNQY